MQTTDTDYLFQSDAQLEQSSARQEKSLRTAKAGSPFKLSSKPLDAVIHRDAGDAAETSLWTAESGFVVRKSDVKTGKTKQILKGHAGPVTSLAFYKPPELPLEILFTASWDKLIRAWDAKTGSLLSITANAHSDFVKCLLVIPSLRILISGGSDKDIRIWDLSSDALKAWPSSASPDLEGSGIEPDQSPKNSLSSLAALKGQHTRPIEMIACYPIFEKSSEQDGDDLVPTQRWCLWSADSMGRICTWEIYRDKQQNVRADFKTTWLAHETAIYEMRVTEGELWTVSADHLATLWTHDPTEPFKQPTATIRLPHPSYVKTILPLEQLLPGNNMQYVITGCSDEQIRIWDLSQLDDLEGAGLAYSDKAAKKSLISNAANALEAYKDGKRPPGLAYELEGHFHEVCKLMLWSAKEEQAVDATAQGTLSPSVSGKEEVYIVSAGLDCTVRKWKLKDVLALAKIGGSGKEKDEKTDLEKKTVRDIQYGREEQPKTSAMTAEEEAELAELMDED